MGIWISRIDDDVIQIDNNVDIQALRQDTIDVGLEGCRSIGEAEGQDLIFEMTVPGPECSLPLVALLDAHTMVCGSDIQCSIYRGFAQAI